LQKDIEKNPNSAAFQPDAIAAAVTGLGIEI
jgi:hypothetical protein